ncbi:hypothetical protein C5S42_00105 [Candidatus Methanomarinus sp.]|nr:hypothetical protein C5S42_00105 [ANME-2 cluster archaeon]
MDKRFCIICGRTPKNNCPEHIIPDWLIRFTGNRNRVVNLGPQKNVDNYPERQYAFSRFVFPSCSTCNSRLSELENRASTVMKKTLRGDMLTSDELCLLMDWFDKVRAGIRLGYYILDGNPEDIRIRHYVEDSIGLYDRALAIYIDDSSREMLSFFQTDTPLFGIFGNCALFRVNNYWFLSIAAPFLVSRRIGLPFPENFVDLGDQLQFNLLQGLERIITPVLGFRPPPLGSLFYQAKFKSALHDDKIKAFYKSSYLSKVCSDVESGNGMLFQEPVRGEPVAYPSIPSNAWKPPLTKFSSIGPRLVRDTLSIQEKLCAF